MDGAFPGFFCAPAACVLLPSYQDSAKLSTFTILRKYGQLLPYPHPMFGPHGVLHVLADPIVGVGGFGGSGVLSVRVVSWNAESYPKMEDATPTKTYLRETPIRCEAPKAFALRARDTRLPCWGRGWRHLGRVVIVHGLRTRGLRQTCRARLAARRHAVGASGEAMVERDNEGEQRCDEKKLG